MLKTECITTNLTNRNRLDANLNLIRGERYIRSAEVQRVNDSHNEQAKGGLITPAFHTNLLFVNRTKNLYHRESKPFTYYEK